MSNPMVTEDSIVVSSSILRSDGSLRIEPSGLRVSCFVDHLTLLSPDHDALLG